MRRASPSGRCCRLLADAFFRAERVSPDAIAELAQGFGVAIVLDGEGRLETEAGGELELRRGATVLIPWAAGAARIDGVTAIVCRPPGDG